ncbi:MAG: hypothetical protein JXR96_04445 [Deltaproteobacteria bacterium]|nr:hypothetical protein [Deltaproteobacteria bacterium]
MRMTRYWVLFGLGLLALGCTGDDDPGEYIVATMNELTECIDFKPVNCDTSAEKWRDCVEDRQTALRNAGKRLQAHLLKMSPDKRSGYQERIGNKIRQAGNRFARMLDEFGKACPGYSGDTLRIKGKWEAFLNGLEYTRGGAAMGAHARQ